MLRRIGARAAACSVALLFVGAAHAQNPNAPGQQKKQANQVPDTGVGDVADAPATGGPFDRASNVPITIHANGMISAALDESYMEAQTVIVRPDGTLEYRHISGLDHAVEALLQPSSEQKAAEPVDALVPLLPVLPLRLGLPVLEER